MFELALDNMPMLLNSINETISQLREERNFLLLIIAQLMLDTGKYDMKFTDEEAKILEEFRVLIGTDETGDYKVSLIFPEQ